MGGSGRANLEFEGRPTAPDAPPLEAVSLTVTPEYFDTVGTALRRGRGFNATDGTPGNETIIVNERFAARFFPTEDPIGKRVRVRPRDPKAKPNPWLMIVGISPTIRQGDPQAMDPDAVMYRPYRQFGFGSMVILARTQGAPASLASALRNAVREADPDQSVYQVRTMNEQLAQMQWPYRVFGSMFAIFALIALALSAVGIYAVTSYSVTQRTPEIGVRMAMGAQPGQVWWMVLKQGLIQLGLGLGIGLAAGFFLANVLKVLVVQIPSRDPVTFGTITVVLALVMLVACLVPARRATRLDPLAALRVE
jgi:putative ABC transport system permease protein